MLSIISGLILGIAVGLFIIFYTPLFSTDQKSILSANTQTEENQVVGFLPYWLISKAKSDYPKYITTLSYFSLTLDHDGKIKKFENPGESEPGWYALKSGKADDLLNKSKSENIKLSLAVFNGDPEEINLLISNPIQNARNMLSDILPVMKAYGFSDLNLDIENTMEASEEARINYTKFVSEVKKGLLDKNAGTLTLDISAIDFFKKKLINPVDVAPIVDYLLIMGYDYHYTGSIVTGPVSPLFGAGKTLEFDIQTVVQKTLEIMPPDKIILGIPLYGYEWETIQEASHSAVIPGTGLTASNMRVEGLINTCPECIPHTDSISHESYIIYKDEDTGTYHQIYYPDKAATDEKVKFVQDSKLAGIALWALGYEGHTILDPLEKYIIE